MDHRDNHPRQSPDGNVSPEALDLDFAGLSEPEEDDIFEVQSFDEDDMWTDDCDDHTPDSDDGSKMPSDDVILMLLESVDVARASLIGIVCHTLLNHSSCSYSPQFDDIIQEIRDLRTDIENVSVMAREHYEARMRRTYNSPGFGLVQVCLSS